MSLLKRYQTTKSCLSKYKKPNNSSIQKLYANSLHNPFLDPIDMMSHPFYRNSEQYAKLANAATNNDSISSVSPKFPKVRSQPLKINFNQIPNNQQKQIQTSNDIQSPNISCDFGFPQAKIILNSTPNSPNRKDIDLPILDKLPSIFDSSKISQKEEQDYLDLLQKKFELVNIQLNFSNPDMDRPAKQIRLSTIYEICQIFIGLDPNKHTQIFQMIFSFLTHLVFRPIVVPFPQFLFSDDIVLIVDPELGQLNHCYNALRTVLIESKLSQQNKNKFFDRNFIRNLFLRFNAPDIDERSTLARFVLDILTYCTVDNLSFVLSLCYYELSFYFSANRLPYVLMPPLSILYNIFGQKLKTLHLYYKDFVDYVMPVLTANHLVLCSEQMINLIELFVKNGNNEITSKILKAIIQHFPYNRTSKILLFLTMLLKISPVVNQLVLQEFMVEIFEIISKCISFPHTKISDLSKCLFINDKMQVLLNQNRKLLFPVILGILLSPSCCECPSDVQLNIQEVLERLKNIDANSFNQCCIKCKENSNNGNQYSLTQWIQIAKAASANDNTIDLSTTLPRFYKEYQNVQ